MSRAQTVRGDYRVVPIDTVHPNGFNYNVEDPAVYESLRASFRRHGAVQPAVVRDRPAGGVEIINGEHRWRAAREEGATDFAILDLGQVSDVEAKELSILLNEIGGEPDRDRLAGLLKDIHIDVDFPDLAAVMPFPPDELSSLLAAAQPPPVVPTKPINRPPRRTGTPAPPAGRIKKLSFQLSVDDHRAAAGVLARWSGDPNRLLLEALGLLDGKRKAAERKAATKRRGRKKA